MSDVPDLTLAISSNEFIARSVSTGSLVMIAKIEYGSAADRRVVDKVSSRAVPSSLCTVSRLLYAPQIHTRLTSSQDMGKSESIGIRLTD